MVQSSGINRKSGLRFERIRFFVFLEESPVRYKKFGSLKAGLVGIDNMIAVYGGHLRAMHFRKVICFPDQRTACSENGKLQEEFCLERL